jgi:hypothetical protein
MTARRATKPRRMPAMSDPVIGAAIERLVPEFAGRLPFRTIAAVVHQCRHDLDGSPAPALPELVERLARHRLIDVLPAATANPAR